MPKSVVGQRVEHAHLAFALALQGLLTPSRTETLCWSPFSVASALGLAATGARGRTRDELTTLLLGDPHGSLAEHGTMLAEAAELTGSGASEPPILGVANTLWTIDDLPVEPEFLAELSGWPNGALRHAPFRTDPEAVRQAINQDVAVTTHQLIPELLAPGTIEPQTLAALVNALYLKTGWLQEFPGRATEQRPFHGPGRTTEVSTMRLTRKLGYAATGGWQSVVLAANGGVRAAILLPDGDLGETEATLDADRLAALLDDPVPTQVELFLPRFKVRLRSPLDSALRELGAGTMFSDVADFSGISRVPLTVSTVQHEAVLTIDEQGLEGAAATAVMFLMSAMTRSPEPEPVVVRVDRPFLFVVRHQGSGAVYFLARVVSP